MKSMLRIFVTLIILLYSSSANAFKFDIWESGMDADTVLIVAKNNGIELTGGDTKYSYKTKILNREATVLLELTRGDYKLMELRINWFNDIQELVPMLRKIIADKNPISTRNHYEYALIMCEKYSYLLDKNTSVDIEVKFIQLLEMIYKDLNLSKIDAKRQAWDKKEVQRKAVMKDIDKFNPDIHEKGNEEEGKIYRWTDESGVTHFSNMQEGKSASVVKMKPIGKVQLKEILWYNVYLKNGSKIKVKKIERISKEKLAIFENTITTEIVINEISQIEETSKVGGKIQVELRSPDSF